MEGGVVDVGRFSPFGYVDAVHGGKIRVIAQSLLEGSPTYRGLIITRFDSDIHSLADLEGKRFAFVDSQSPAGYIYPRATLIASGFDPERSFKETIVAGSHDKVITAVLLGPAHAGAVYEGAVPLATAKGLPTFDLVVLGMTDPIPYDAIAVRTGLEAALIEQIQTALVGLDKSPAGRQVIGRGQGKLTGYAPADDTAYDGARRTLRISGR
jgi:phosphonate transport system substrate-binding protein